MEIDAREIPISGRLYELLKKRARPSGPIFLFHKKPIQEVKRSWMTAQTEANLSVRYCFHDLRHTFAHRSLDVHVAHRVHNQLQVPGLLQNTRSKIMPAAAFLRFPLAGQLHDDKLAIAAQSLFSWQWRR